MKNSTYYNPLLLALLVKFTTQVSSSCHPTFSSFHMQRISTYVQSWQTRVFNFLRHPQAPLIPPLDPPGSKDLDFVSEPFVSLQADHRISSTEFPTPQHLLDHTMNSPTTRSQRNSWHWPANNLLKEPTQLCIPPTQTDDCDSQQSQLSSISPITPPLDKS